MRLEEPLGRGVGGISILIEEATVCHEERDIRGFPSCSLILLFQPFSQTSPPPHPVPTAPAPPPSCLLGQQVSASSQAEASESLVLSSRQWEASDGL